MNDFVLAPVALLLGIHLFGNPNIHREYHRVGSWRYITEYDNFTKSESCRLRARRMEYKDGAVWFRFGKRADTTNAWFQIDNERARPWRQLFPDLIRHHIRYIDESSLSNPSGGEVIIPIDVLSGASKVTIRATANSRPKTFRIAGLAAALKSAQDNGCPF